MIVILDGSIDPTFSIGQPSDIYVIENYVLDILYVINIDSIQYF